MPPKKKGMMSKIAHVAVVAALLSAINADAATLRSTKTAQAPWQLSKVQPKVNLQEEVQMSIGLKRKNIDLLEKILLEVSDPKSSRYGDHLSEAQLRNLVGASPASVEEVKEWLTVSGVPASQVTVSAHMDAIKFTATRAQVASLLKVEWSTYDNTLSKQTSIRALGAIQIPDALQGVVEVVAGHRGWPMQMMPKKASISDNANITPKKIYEVYQETEIPTTPAGQTNIQSFFQAYGQAVKASDLTYFCAKYLLLQPGFNGTCKIAKYVGGQDLPMPGMESSLDSQYITATSYGADTWAYTYNGADFCSDLLSWAQDVFGESGSPHPNVISMSYGSQSMLSYCTGQGAQRLHEDTMKMGAAGISVLIASGDMGSGLYSREGYNNGNLNPSFPAELPYVTSVGSTTFVAGNSGTQRAVSFSGGGFSWTWEAPSYQKAAIHEFLTTSTQLPTLGKYNKTGRGTPDVSFLGEGFNIINGGQAMQVGGTSCSTPSWAGMITLLNNIRLEKGKTLGFLNPLLYSNAAALHDIEAGSNSNTHAGSGFHAKSGWDASSGMGTPNFNKLAAVVKALNGGGTPAPVTPSPNAPPTPVTPTPNSGATFESLKCVNPDCTNCQSTVEPQNTCITSGDFSFKASCGTDALVIQEYNDNACHGAYNITSQPINVCEVSFARRLATYNLIKCGGSGPGPVPPTPPSPPSPVTPAPAAPTTPSPAAGKTFTQKICTNSACTSGCQSHTFPQDQCLGLQGGGSAKATCTATSLTLTEYPSSSTCTGFSIPTTQPINQCAKDQQGTYLENSCANGLIAATKGAKFHTTADLAVKVAAMMKRN